jgi:hypothetical protein
MFNALCLSYPSIVRRLETVGYIHQGKRLFNSWIYVA